jgi:hypothetical protein
LRSIKVSKSQECSSRTSVMPKAMLSVAVSLESGEVVRLLTIVKVAMIVKVVDRCECC